MKVDEITALIGPNEAGKSSLLQGLDSLSMDEEYGSFDLTQLEGVAKKNLDGDLPSEDIEIVWAKFALSPEDREILTKIQDGDATGLGNEPERTHLEVRKFYDGFYKISVRGNDVRFPSRRVIQAAQERIGTELETLSTKAGAEHFGRQPNNQFRGQFDEILKAANRIKVWKQQEGQQLVQKLEELLQLGYDEDFKKFIRSHVGTVRKIIDAKALRPGLEEQLYDYVLGRMPRTVYFRNYERMEDEVAITELRQRSQKHKTILNFLTLAEIKLDTLEQLERTNKSQIPVYLENGCGKATNLLREAWNQEVLDIELRYLDGRLLVFTKNSKAVETLLPPSSGSEGFQWYFGFYINFGAATKAEYKNAVLLLDDPGVYLHPAGHKQLLELFDKYLENNVMTIYSTHLPFLIPKGKLQRLRLVEKTSTARSHVTEKFWAVSDKDVLYPLRAALGITLADSLFVGSTTIIAEGPSDGILLNGMLDLFRQRGLRPLKDTEDIQILAGKGATRAKENAILLQIEKLPYVLVLDNDQEGQNAREEAIEDGIPEDRIVLLPGLPESKQKEFDIEDLFPSEVYGKAFHKAHGGELDWSEEDTIKKLSEGNEKVNNRAKRLLKEGNYELDKVRVAKEILKIVGEGQLNKLVEERFGELFDELNTRVGLYL